MEIKVDNKLRYGEDGYKNLIYCGLKSAINLGYNPFEKNIFLFVETNLPAGQGIGKGVSLVVAVTLSIMRCCTGPKVDKDYLQKIVNIRLN